MEENKYQKLGLRTLLYDIAASSKIPLIILAVTLVLMLIRTNTDSNFNGILGALVFWGFMATVIAMIAVILVSWLQYSMFQFSLGSDIFKIKRGVFIKRESAIPYRRIESVDIRRTLIHQIFGVSRISIETTIDSEATSDSKKNTDDEVFPVIEHHLAQNIQEELTKRANVQKMRV